MRFPRSLQFKVKPKVIIHLANQYSESAYTPRPPREELLQKWRALLLSNSSEVMQQWRFQPEWSQVLPHLISPAEDQAIRLKAFSLFIRYISKFRLSKVIYIAANTPRPKLITYLKSKYPPEELPLWIQYIELSERSVSLTSACQIAWSVHPHFESILQWLELPKNTQVYNEGWNAAIKTSPNAVVYASCAEWLNIITSRAEQPRRSQARLERLARLVEQSPQSQTTQRWYDSGIAFLGGSISEYPQRWKEMSQGSQNLARLIEDFRVRANEAIINFFNYWVSDQDRADYWQSKLSLITDFHLFDSSTGALMIKIGERYFIEFGEKGNACYSYDQEEWNSIKNIENPSIWELKVDEKRHGEHWLSHRRGWQSRFNDYIERYCFGLSQEDEQETRREQEQ